MACRGGHRACAQKTSLGKKILLPPKLSFVTMIAASKCACSVHEEGSDSNSNDDDGAVEMVEMDRE